MVRAYLRLLVLALRRPLLAVRLLGAAWAFRRRRWWRRPPFLPVPPAGYLAWRLHTVYGDPQALPTPAELARYLRWAAKLRRRTRRGGRP